MVKMQIDLSEEEDRIVDVFKMVNRLKTKQEAIKVMIKQFEVDIKPIKMEKEKYYQKTEYFKK